MVLPIIFGICVILVILYPILMELYFRTTPSYKTALNYPGGKFHPYVGHLFEVLGLKPDDLFQFPRDNALKFRRSYRKYVLGLLHLNVIRAKEVEAVLAGFKHMDKSPTYAFLHPFLGTGLLTSKGEKWQQRRRILTPTFHFNILEQFLVIFQEEAERLIQTIREAAEKQDTVNVGPIATQFTLNTVCETAMGVKLNDVEGSQKYRNNIYAIAKIFVYRFTRPIMQNEIFWAIFGYKRAMNKLLIPVHDFTSKIIKERRDKFFTKNSEVHMEDPFLLDENIYQTKKRRYAMLDTLLAVETKGLIDSEGVREEVDTFTFEGHDTSAACLMFTLLLLAHNPEAQERILLEVVAMRKDNDSKKFTVNDLNNMKYLDRLLKESLRLYPPVPYIARTLTEDLELDGFTFPKGSVAHIHTYDIHRDPEVFSDPEKFDPDRFLPEAVANRNPFAYVPFSAGPRNCIGQKFAILEIKTAIIEIVSNFVLEPITRREDVVFVGDVVLRAKNPIKIKFQTRRL